MEHSPELDKLAAALAKAQGQVTGAAKSAVNPHFGKTYADLASVWDAMRKPFADNGLSVVHMPGFGDGKITLETMLLHESGQWVKGVLAMPFAAEPGRNAAQSIGSALTYMRRYVDSSIGSVAPEDDDGESAGKPEAMKLPGKPEHFGGHGGKPLPDVPTDELIKACKFFTDKDAKKNAALIRAIEHELASRNGGEVPA
jgi:hypothetical protein